MLPSRRAALGLDHPAYLTRRREARYLPAEARLTAENNGAVRQLTNPPNDKVHPPRLRFNYLAGLVRGRRQHLVIARIENGRLIGVPKKRLRIRDNSRTCLRFCTIRWPLNNLRASGRPG